MTRRLIAGALMLSSVVSTTGPLRGQAEPSGQELTLAKAVTLALRNNPSVKAADAYAEATHQGIMITRASRYPRLDFSEGFTRGNNPVYVFGTLLMQQQFTATNFALPFLNTPPPLDNFRTQFTASMPLFDAGQTSHNVRDAQLNVQSAERAKDRAGQQIIFNVINAYFDELLADEGVRVALASRDMTEADLARAQARQDQGLAVASDVLSAQVQLAQAKEGVIRAHNAVEIAQGRLDVAMGVAEGAPHKLLGTLGETNFEAAPLDELEKRALRQRPDYLAAVINQDKAANDLVAARSAFLPTVSLFSSWELDNRTFAARGGNNWMAGASLNFTVFDGGASRARLGAARAREWQAEALRDQTAAAVRLEVREAYLNLNAAHERLNAAREASSQAEESLRILRNRYETGLLTISDLLQAETARTSAQKSLLNAVYDYRLASAALELATGDLGPNSPAVVR